jgi:hypothetical protein
VMDRSLLVDMLGLDFDYFDLPNVALVMAFWLHGTEMFGMFRAPSSGGTHSRLRSLLVALNFPIGRLQRFMVRKMTQKRSRSCRSCAIRVPLWWVLGFCVVTLI